MAPVRTRAFALAFLLPTLLACRRPPSGRGHDLILVTLDTVRADHIGAYGYARARTPTLDALARTGVRFETAVSAVPLTLPSHATILSGFLPPRHALHGNGAGRLPSEVPTLGETLHAAGYQTAAFVGAFVLDRRFGLGRGFDHYDDEIDPERAQADGLGAERSGREVMDRALAWLARTRTAGARPLFTWIHLYDAHAPYDPPADYRREGSPPYDGEIAFVDAQLARLVAALDTLPDRPTVVAVVADHGESLGEHGEPTHGVFLYEPTLRVPFILQAPALLPRGYVVHTPVGLADVAPTLSGLLEIPSSEGAPAPDGRDLSRWLRQSKEPPLDDLYAETEYPRTFGWSALHALRRGTLKYVAAPRPELYALDQDPAEAHDIAGTDPHGPALAQRLDKWRAAPPLGSSRGSLDAESRERLAALGYAVAGAEATPRAEGATGPDPKDTIALFRQFEEANAALFAGRTAEAVRMLELLVRADPNSVFQGLLAKAYRQQGALPRAIELYRRAVAAAPDDPEARYNLAVALQEAGRSAESAAALVEAIRRDPERAEAHNALGIALFGTGRLKDALAAFDQAVVLDPRDARAHNNRGNVLREMGRFPEAEMAYRRAGELSPTYADPLNGLGTLEVQRDRPQEAIPWFDRALLANPTLHEARLNRAIAFEMMHDGPRAAAAYREFLDLSRNDPSFAAQRRTAEQLLARLPAARR